MFERVYCKACIFNDDYICRLDPPSVVKVGYDSYTDTHNYEYVQRTVADDVWCSYGRKDDDGNG